MAADLGARDPQLKGAAAAGSAVEDLDGIPAGRDASRALSPLWGTDQTPARGGRRVSVPSAANTDETLVQEGTKWKTFEEFRGGTFWG
jgi:hypothetical protein